MPVKEITVFKDGHTFVLHAGKMPTDTSGNVLMDYLPTPVLGTFWPYSADKNVRLSAVTASQRRVLVERTALSLRELLEANPGAEVGITEVNGKGYGAKIVGVPARSAEEFEAASPPNTDPRLPEKANVILLQTVNGVSAVPIDRIQDVTFKGEYRSRLPNEEFRNLLTLKLEWPNGRRGQTADVGMLYLQKGLRWIPHYKVDLDGKGNAVIKLQATLINELTDLEDVTAHLVIGVPSFFFQDTPDPISLQSAFAQLSPYFQRDAQTGFALSNAIMAQTARMGERAGGIGGGLPGPAGPPDLGPEVAGSEKSEDLFVFTVKHVTLKKNQRMVLPVAEYTLKYRDVYTLDLPFAPPPEVRAQINSQQQAELARLLNAPKVMHKIRLTNRSQYPLTTAPALIVRGDQVLAQGMMTYTAIGAETDLALTTAVDIKVKKSDKETMRTPNAVVWQGNQYGRVDLAGTISLTNYGDEAVDLEVVRHVLGNIGKADHDGAAEMVNVFEDDGYIPAGRYPYWWNWYNWPHWWYHFNGVGRVTWKFKLDAGKSIDLGYTWHYYWQ